MTWNLPTDGGDANTWGGKLRSSLQFLKNFVDIGATQDFANGAASTAKTDAVSAAKAYTDTTAGTAQTNAVASAKTYTDTTATSTRSGAVADAKTYTDSAVATVNRVIVVPAGTTVAPAGTAPGTLVLFLS